MNIESFREYCILKPGVTEEFPFGESTLVFKVGGKMFALTDVDNFVSINLKCDPARSMELREKYEAITAGYHMSKKHWNTILMNGQLPQALITELIDHSYELVFSNLPSKIKSEIGAS